MAFDLNKLLTLLDEGIKIKNKISKEIGKEKDASKRKKYNDAADKALSSGSDSDLAAVRDLLFKL